LLKNPGALQKHVEVVTAYLLLDTHVWWSIEFESAIELPQRVLPKGHSMRKEIVTARLSLSPVPSVVNADEAKRTGHPDNDAEIDEQTFKRL
jgi:hypothetical protein